MKIFTITTILTLTLLASSCNNSANQNHSTDPVIELNNGQKWKVNEEMTPFILAGYKILNEYSGTDFRALAKQLKSENNSLIKSCTMDGKSHDELHKWLHPHLELVDELKNAESEQKATEIIASLKKSYQAYNAYFE